MQIFVRREQGMENLNRLFTELEKRDFPFQAHAHVLFEIRAILQELDGIEREIEKIGSVGLFSSPSEAKLRAKELLEKRRQTLLDQLDRIAG